MEPPPIRVAAAALIREGRVLVQQRPLDKGHGGLWEFPGGKLEPGEAPEIALARELAEELGIALGVHDFSWLAVASSDGPPAIEMALYAARRWAGEPRPIEAPAMLWCTLDELAELPMPPVDVALLPALSRLLSV